jgi:hypothetical protein
MSSSVVAFSFFTQWLNAKTKLCVIAIFDDVAVSGFGWIKSLDEDLFLANPEASFSLRVPLKGCPFESSDPEHSSGLPVLDELIRGTGFKFGWEIVLPSNARILLAELGKDTP